MSASLTLLKYLSKQFFTSFLIFIGVLLMVIYLVDTLELIRRAASHPEVTFGQIAKMSFFQLPDVGQQLFQFAVLFGALFTFWRLTRTSELVVLRAVGVSAWEFLLPAVLVAATIGVVKVAVINPIGSAFSARFEQMDNTLLRGKTSTIDLSAGGLWLRQSARDSYTIIHARNVDSTTWKLKDVSIYFLTNNDDLTGRLDASDAALVGDKWVVNDGKFNRPDHPDEPPTPVPTMSISTDMTPGKIQEIFASPKSHSFWTILHYIRTMETTGISAVRLRLQYMGLLADPFLYAGLVLIAAAAGLRQTRRGGTLFVIATGIIAAFALFFLGNVVRALGESETIPIALAAWTPAGLSLLGGVGALLYLEDG
ncbi:MAG TPA: LPS export ABC transporter permease LptG [Alphaproteobacteria bacterium]|jgi:lipopolysaccharide export system permease protein|nr:LPS export ABC transporter permease LptG [Alphaproteobacteria bacterium]